MSQEIDWDHIIDNLDKLTSEILNRIKHESTNILWARENGYDWKEIKVRLKKK